MLKYQQNLVNIHRIGENVKFSKYCRKINSAFLKIQIYTNDELLKHKKVNPCSYDGNLFYMNPFFFLIDCN